MFLFGSRNPCTFRGISVYLGFSTSGIGIRNPSASVMIVGVAGNTVNVLRYDIVLGHQGLLRVLGWRVGCRVADKTVDEQPPTGGGGGGVQVKFGAKLKFTWIC